MRTHFLIFLIFFLFAGASVAQARVPRRYYDWSSTLDVRVANVLGEATESAQIRKTQPIVYQRFNRYVFGGDFTPTSPFYFIKRVQETIQLTTTFNQDAKEKLQIAIAGERLEEIKTLSDTTNTGAIRQASAGYEQIMRDIVGELEKQKQSKKPDQEFIKLIEEETAKHAIVLEESRAKLADDMQPAIEVALVSSWEGIDKTADLAQKPALPSDVVDRIQALKAQGLLTGEEANKLISVKTRSEARNELRKYVKEGVLPEADFIRLNENVKTYFPYEFYKMHEVKRFYELRKLEEQQPDEVTLSRIQEFAKTYQQGDIVPSDIRRYWVPIIRLEEIQNTLRPDLIDPEIIKTRQEDFRKFTEIIERFKPRPEDYARITDYVRQNPNTQLPPEYERMYELGNKYGAQCGVGQRWVPAPQSGGYCIPEGVTANELPRIEDFAKNRSCNGNVVTAKAPNGACTAYPSDCIPPGWTRTATCVETPQPTSSPQNPRALSCPSNAHFVPVPYAAEGGYCVPNYSPVSPGNDPNTSQTPCTTGYHRNYPGGPCLPDFNPENPYPLVPYTPNPGNYPNPIYPPISSCGSGYHWVPEPISTRGGYCAPDYNQGDCPSGQYRGPGGYCIPTRGGPTSCTAPSTGCGFGTHWDSYSCACKSDTGVSCTEMACGSGLTFDRGTCTCKPSCPSGTSWNGNYCMKDSSPPSGYGNCQTNQYWNGTACVSSDTRYSPSREQQESACRAGGGTCVSWVNNACGCENTSSPRPTNPPSGYGSCGSGLYWNGSACVSSSVDSGSSPSREQQESACRAGGGTCVSWVNNACGCENTSSRPTTPQSTSAPQPTATPNPNDPAEMCRRTNGNWDGSSCVMPTMSPEQSCQSAGGSWNGSSCTMPTVVPTNP